MSTSSPGPVVAAGVPAREVGAVDQPVRARVVDQQLQGLLVVHVGVEPDPPVVVLEAVVPQRLARPRALGHRAGEPAGEERRGTAAVRDADVQAGVAFQNAAEDQRGDGEGLVVGEAEQHVQVEPAQPGVIRGAVRAQRGRVDEQGDIQVDQGLVQRVERRVVEGAPGRVGVDVDPHHAQVAGGAAGLGDRGGNVLHRELGGGQQPARVLACQLGQGVVVRAGEGNGVVCGQGVEVGDRVGGEDLQVDARRVHRRQPDIDVHERAACVLHAVQVVVADPVERRAVRGCAQLRSGRPGRALGEGEHGVRVHVDHARHSAPHFAPGYSPFRAQAVDPMPELPRS